MKNIPRQFWKGTFITILFGIAIQATPVFASNIYTPPCTDYTLNGGGSSCTGTNSVTIPPNDSMFAGNTTSNLSWITSGMTVYVSVNVTGVNNANERIYLSDQVANIYLMPPCDSNTCATGVYVDVPVVISGSWVSSTSDIIGGDTDSSGILNFDSLCVSDTIGACEGLPPPPPTTPYIPFPFPGHEASTTYQIVDNPNQDCFMGVILFLLTFYGLVILLSKSLLQK